MKLLFSSCFLIIFSVVVVSVNCVKSTCKCSCNCDSYRGFTISGNKIIDANGNVFLMRGINQEHSWFKQDIESAAAAIAATGANTIRIVLSNGNRWPKDDYENVKNLIEICEKNKLIMLIDVHDGMGSDNFQDVVDIVKYWKELKDLMVGKEDRIIMNLANEWTASYESHNWAEGSKYAIRELREAGFEHLFIIDTAGWAQYCDAIWDKGMEVFQADKLGRTAFSIHMYENAGGNADNVKYNMEKAASMPFPIIIGEFGDRLPNEKPTDVDAILKYAHEKQIGWTCWSWYGNNPPEDGLDMTKGPGTGYTLTDFGHQVVDSPYGVRATAVRASVYN